MPPQDLGTPGHVSGFETIGWGMFFIFDFSLAGLDILPDIVSYGMWYIGASRLKGLHANATAAMAVAAGLMPFGFFALVPFSLGAAGLVLGLVASALQVAFVGLVCWIVVDLAKARKAARLATTAQLRFLYFAGLTAATVVAVSLAPGYYVTGALGLWLTLTTLLVLGLLWEVMRRAAHLVAAQPGSTEPSPERLY